MTRCTVSGQAPVNPDDAPVPNSERRADGQHVDHWVLCAEERAKGFVRPVRDAYLHVGIAAPTSLRPLTEEEKARWPDTGFVAFEPFAKRDPRWYPGAPNDAPGSYWTHARLDLVGKGCGTKTTMPRAIAETYARKPDYYGSTLCCGCGKYLPVGARGEFVWDGTQERVGT
jgi:hypothetical protein